MDSWSHYCRYLVYTLHFKAIKKYVAEASEMNTREVSTGGRLNL